MILVFSLAVLTFGCQKYGLAFDFPKDSLEEDSFAAKEVLQSGQVTVPTTKAIIMKNEVLDLSNFVSKDIEIKFKDFTLKTIVATYNKKPFVKYLKFEPNDYHNDFSVLFTLDQDGNIVDQLITQEKNGLLVSENRLLYER